MACNINKPAKVPRILVGFFIIILGLFFNSYLTFLGFIPIIMAVVGYCPLCSLKARLIRIKNSKG